MRVLLFLMILFFFPATGLCADKTSTQKPIIKNVIDWIVGKNKTKNSFKKPKPANNKKSSRVISQKNSKLSVLGTSYYKPKKSNLQLSQELNEFLNNLKEVCNTKQNKENLLRKKFKQLKSYLIASLAQDPYMNSQYKMMYEDMIEVLNSIQKENLNKDGFTSSYKQMHKLDENMNLKADSRNYPEKWEEKLLEALKCIEK